MTPVEIIEKEFRRAKRTYTAGIVVLLATLALLIVGTVQFYSAKKDIVSLDAIIESGDAQKTGRMAYIDIDGAISFASRDKTDYYIAYNEKYCYIVSLRQSDADYVQSLFDKSASSLRLYGTTVSIPQEARGYAIERLNEALGEAYVSTANFEDVFGDVCFSISRESRLFGLDGFMDISGGYVIAAVFTLAAGLLLFFTGKGQKKSFAPLLEDGSDPLAIELGEPNVVWYQNLKTYVTEHYLVSVRGNLDAVRFEDIFWAYITKHKTNGVPDYDYLSLVTRDGRQLAVANGGSFGKKHKEETAAVHAEILHKILEKDPSVRIGYTQENLAASRELQREIRQKKKNGEL